MSYSLVEEAAVVELAEESGLGDGVRAVPHLAPPARHVAKVVVPLQVGFHLWIQLNSHKITKSAGSDQCNNRRIASISFSRPS